MCRTKEHGGRKCPSRQGIAARNGWNAWYALNKDKVNAQRRAAYAAQKLRLSGGHAGGGPMAFEGDGEVGLQGVSPEELEAIVLEEARLQVEGMQEDGEWWPMEPRDGQHRKALSGASGGMVDGPIGGYFVGDLDLSVFSGKSPEELMSDGSGWGVFENAEKARAHSAKSLEEIKPIMAPLADYRRNMNADVSTFCRSESEWFAKDVRRGAALVARGDSVEFLVGMPLNTWSQIDGMRTATWDDLPTATKEKYFEMLWDSGYFDYVEITPPVYTEDGKNMISGTSLTLKDNGNSPEENLRGLREAAAKFMRSYSDWLNGAIAGATLPGKALLYRGCRSSDVVSVGGEVRSLGSLRPGDNFELKGVISTSIFSRVAGGFCDRKSGEQVLMEFYSDRGLNCSSTTTNKNGGEVEVLLSQGMGMRVAEVVEGSGGAPRLIRVQVS